MAFQDWFGRTTKHYTSTYKGSTRLAWDSGWKGSYSSFFAPDLNKTKLLKDSFRHACDIKSIMNIPHNINIQLNVDAETSCTNGHTVILSTKAYDDAKLDNNMKLDIFLGTAIHEFSHVLHTDFATMKKHTSETFVNQLFNIIEDERIENLTIQQYPGYANFLGQAKYYYFDLMYDNSNTEPVYQVMANILYIVRYPVKVDEAIISTYDQLFSEIKPILTTLGSNSAEAYTKAEKIYQILLKYLQFPPSNPKNKEGKNNDSGKSNNSGEGNSSGNSKKSSEQKSYNKGEIEAAAQKMAEKIKKIVTANSSLNSDAIRTEMQSMEITDDLKHINPEVVAIKKKNNQTVYTEDFNKIKSSVNELVNAFSKFFVEQDYRLTGMRRGNLDTNKIAEAYQSVETVYYNKFKRTTPGLDVCLLIDESGSMCGTKIEAARTCAILLNEVFSRIKYCNFYIYGHTADTKGHDVVINVYKDSWNKNKYALGEVEADSNNDDSKAIEEVYKMVRKQTNKPLLMFVISDGAPACWRCSGSTAGAKEVKTVVNKIESTKNAIVCQIAIESCCEPETMFNHYVTMTDMNSFPRDLSNYVINTLVSKLRRVDE